MNDLPVALTIAGSDSGGGAGIQADILTFAALGVFATSAITCLTAQNPDGVSGVHAAPPESVRAQAESVAAYFRLGAVKSGMIPNAGLAHAVADFLGAHPEIPYVLDPVMIASSGARLIDDAALRVVRERLVPRATLVTPNLDEAAVFLGRRPENDADALELAARLGVPVLVKGGHADTDTPLDILATPCAETSVFAARRHPSVDTHGSGCTLAAAIAAGLAKGDPLPAAVAAAHAYLQRGIHAPLRVAGREFIAHFPR